MVRFGLPSKLSARRAAQRGVALIYGMFTLVIGLAALFFLFNAGQLTAEKTRLVNAADAVAWSGGVLHARALNTTSYLNRALVANEVLIAQAISLQSWSRMMAGRAQTIGRGVFPECEDRTGRAQLASTALRFGPDYVLMCSALGLPGVVPSVVSAAEALEQATAAAIAGIELNKASIVAAQSALHAPFVLEAMRNDVLQDVARQNYEGLGAVEVQSAGLVAGGLTGLADGWHGVVQRRSGDDRVRLAEVVRTAAAQDDFVRERRWTSSALVPHPVCITRRNEVRRRGGTALIDFDTWQAADTESWWLATLRRWRCSHREIVAIGGGAATAAPDASGDGEVMPRMGNLPSDAERPVLALPSVGGADENRMAWNRVLQGAASTLNTAYTGLPGFHDLSPDLLTRPDGDPRVDFSVRLVRDRRDVQVSDGRSSIAPGDRLNRYDTTAAGGVISAVASSQVFFARPAEHLDNVYGARTSTAGSQELASLFNPFWQVRLIDLPADVASQRLRQAGAF